MVKTRNRQSLRTKEKEENKQEISNVQQNNAVRPLFDVRTNGHRMADEFVHYLTSAQNKLKDLMAPTPNGILLRGQALRTTGNVSQQQLQESLLVPRMMQNNIHLGWMQYNSGANMIIRNYMKYYGSLQHGNHPSYADMSSNPLKNFYAQHGQSIIMCEINCLLDMEKDYIQRIAKHFIIPLEKYDPDGLAPLGIEDKAVIKFFKFGDVELAQRRCRINNCIHSYCNRLSRHDVHPVPLTERYIKTEDIDYNPSTKREPIKIKDLKKAFIQAFESTEQRIPVPDTLLNSSRTTKLFELKDADQEPIGNVAVVYNAFTKDKCQTILKDLQKSPFQRISNSFVRYLRVSSTEPDNEKVVFSYTSGDSIIHADQCTDVESALIDSAKNLLAPFAEILYKKFPSDLVHKHIFKANMVQIVHGTCSKGGTYKLHCDAHPFVCQARHKLLPTREEMIVATCVFGASATLFWQASPSDRNRNKLLTTHIHSGQWHIQGPNVQTVYHQSQPACKAEVNIPRTIISIRFSLSLNPEEILNLQSIGTPFPKNVLLPTDQRLETNVMKNFTNNEDYEELVLNAKSTSPNEQSHKDNFVTRKLNNTRKKRKTSPLIPKMNKVRPYSKKLKIRKSAQSEENRELSSDEEAEDDENEEESFTFACDRWSPSPNSKIIPSHDRSY